MRTDYVSKITTYNWMKDILLYEICGSHCSENTDVGLLRYDTILTYRQASQLQMEPVCSSRTLLYTYKSIWC